MSMRALVPFLLALMISADDICQPKIEVPPSIHIYKKISTIEADVYNCHYSERISTEGKYVIQESNYTDFTSVCIDAFKYGIFRDKYGNTNDVKINGTKEFSNPYNPESKTDTGYGDGDKFTKNVNITLRQFQAAADLTQNEIYLPGGTTCKYQHGFCYDKNNNAEFVWEVQEIEDTYCSSKLQKFQVEDDSFFMTLNKDAYLISKVDQHFAVLRLESERSISVCNILVNKTSQNGVYISLSSENAEATKPGGKKGLNKKDYTVYFEERQQLYDFLVRKCLRDMSSFSTFDLSEEAFHISIEVERVAERTDRYGHRLDEDGNILKTLKDQTEILSGRVDLLIIIVAVLSGCLISAGIALFFKLICSVGKGRLKGTGGRNKVNAVMQAGDRRISILGSRGTELYSETYGAHYETIPSDYNINSVYGKCIIRNSRCY